MKSILSIPVLILMGHALAGEPLLPAPGSLIILAPPKPTTLAAIVRCHVLMWTDLPIGFGYDVKATCSAEPPPNGFRVIAPHMRGCVARTWGIADGSKGTVEFSAENCAQ